VTQSLCSRPRAHLASKPRRMEASGGPPPPVAAAAKFITPSSFWARFLKTLPPTLQVSHLGHHGTQRAPKGHWSSGCHQTRCFLPFPASDVAEIREVCGCSRPERVGATSGSSRGQGVAPLAPCRASTSRSAAPSFSLAVSSVPAVWLLHEGLAQDKPQGEQIAYFRRLYASYQQQFTRERAKKDSEVFACIHQYRSVSLGENGASDSGLTCAARRDGACHRPHLPLAVHSGAFQTTLPRVEGDEPLELCP
jgi:hypothetical protein